MFTQQDSSIVRYKSCNIQIKAFKSCLPFHLQYATRISIIFITFYLSKMLHLTIFFMNKIKLSALYSYFIIELLFDIHVYSYTLHSSLYQYSNIFIQKTNPWYLIKVFNQEVENDYAIIKTRPLNKYTLYMYFYSYYSLLKVCIGGMTFFTYIH